MEDCLFCKIANNELAADKVQETDEYLAFRDIHPAGPVHILLIPKRHIGSAQDVTAQDAGLIGRIQAAIPAIANAVGLTNGYRLVSNVGFHGQQTVPHLHYHLIGGRQLGWPPG